MINLLPITMLGCVFASFCLCVYHLYKYILALREKYFSPYEPNHLGLGIMWGVALAFSIILYFSSITIIESISKNMAEREKETVSVREQIEIIALSDNTTSTGKFTGIFYIQSGKIEDKMIYRMMVKEGNRARYFNLPMDTTDLILFKNGTDKPHIELNWTIQRYVKTGKMVEQFMGDSVLEGFSEYSGYGILNDIVIHVPEGSILSDFDVDLK